MRIDFNAALFFIGFESGHEVRYVVGFASYFNNKLLIDFMLEAEWQQSLEMLTIQPVLRLPNGSRVVSEFLNTFYQASYSEYT